MPISLRKAADFFPFPPGVGEKEEEPHIFDSSMFFVSGGQI
jgi:hypothetical protein